MTEKRDKNNEVPECPFCQSRENRNPIEKIKEKLIEGFQQVPRYFSIGAHTCNNIIHGKSENRKRFAEIGEACVKKYENIECPDAEHTIIIVNHKDPDKQEYVFGSGVDLLVDYFNKKPIKFRLYRCSNANCFYKSINETKAQNIWIFAHGRRHSISFGVGKENSCSFCKFEGKPRKKFIAQLHCCHGKGKTLWEYLSDEKGLFSEGFREIIQNREDIEKWITDHPI
jgi:hypothetical protein